MKVRTVCGSMDFFSNIVSIREYLEAAGLQVSIPAAEEVKVDYSGASDSDLSRMKKLFIDEHLAKIEVPRRPRPPRNSAIKTVAPKAQGAPYFCTTLVTEG